ncbi:GPO family capsid scaffolding protein [Pseudomonas azerbaijanoccidentalis]
MTIWRQIERSWIEDMATQYSPNTYGARINCEHIKGYWPGGEFGAYGDVVALKAEEVEINGAKKLALFGQLQPNDALLALNKAGQKVYTSIEVQPKFADTGKAYLVGLAITDTPASLGTEALSFSAQHGTLSSRKAHSDNLFTAAEEVALEFEEVSDQPQVFSGLKEKINGLFTRLKGKDDADQEQFAELGTLISQLTDAVGSTLDANDKAQAELQALTGKHDALATKFADLEVKLGKTADHSQQHRPSVTGGENQVLTQF